MQKVAQLFGTREKTAKAMGIALRNLYGYLSGKTPVTSVKLGSIVNMAKELGKTEQELIDILLDRK